MFFHIAMKTFSVIKLRPLSSIHHALTMFAHSQTGFKLPAESDSYVMFFFFGESCNLSEQVFLQCLQQTTTRSVNL